MKSNELFKILNILNYNINKRSNSIFFAQNHDVIEKTYKSSNTIMYNKKSKKKKDKAKFKQK